MWESWGEAMKVFAVLPVHEPVVCMDVIFGILYVITETGRAYTITADGLVVEVLTDG